MADLVYLVTQGNLFNYADDNSVSVNHTELHVVRSLRQPEAEVTVKWFTETAMKANATKFQGIFMKRNKDVLDFKLSGRGQFVGFSKSITVLGIL